MKRNLILSAAAYALGVCTVLFVQGRSNVEIETNPIASTQSTEATNEVTKVPEVLDEADLMVQIVSETGEISNVRVNSPCAVTRVESNNGETSSVAVVTFTDGSTDLIHSAAGPVVVTFNNQAESIQSAIGAPIFNSYSPWMFTTNATNTIVNAFNAPVYAWFGLEISPDSTVAPLEPAGLEVELPNSSPTTDE